MIRKITASIGILACHAPMPYFFTGCNTVGTYAGTGKAFQLNISADIPDLQQLPTLLAQEWRLFFGGQI
jgi:hypothetical protein